jgi:hypothetical protein
MAGTPTPDTFFVTGLTQQQLLASQRRIRSTDELMKRFIPALMFLAVPAWGQNVSTTINPSANSLVPGLVTNQSGAGTPTSFPPFSTRVTRLVISVLYFLFLFGAQAQNVSPRPPGWLNVRDYGAKCDYATDDTAAINAALAATNPTWGGEVYLPPGGCAISAPRKSVLAEGLAVVASVRWINHQQR